MYVNKKDIDLSHITNDESLTCPKLPLPILTPYFDCLLPDPHTFQQKYVVALYEGEWFLAEVYKDQKRVSAGYTKLSFMSIRGHKKFIWAKPDILDTVNEDILLKDVSPIYSCS